MLFKFQVELDFLFWFQVELDFRFWFQVELDFLFWFQRWNLIVGGPDYVSFLS